jgi:fucose permease
LTAVPYFGSGLLLAIASASIFSYGMVAALAGTMVPRLTWKFHLSAMEIGSLFLLQAAGMIVASLAVGPLIDWRGTRIAMLSALGALSAALLALPWSSRYEHLLGLMMLLGTGGGCLTTATSALISELAKQRRAALLSLTKCSYGLGGFATPLIGATLLSRDTIYLCYPIAALNLLIAAMVILTRFPRMSNRVMVNWSEARALFRLRSLQLLSLMLFLYVACEVGVFNWLPKYLISRGIPEASALAIVSVGFALGLVVGRLLFAVVLIRVPPHIVITVSSIVFTATMTLLLQSRQRTVYAVTVFITGLMMAPTFPSIVAIVGETFTRLTASAMGIVITCGWFGLAFSSRLIGYVSAQSGNGVQTGLWMLPVCSALLVALSVLLWQTTAARNKKYVGRGSN